MAVTLELSCPRGAKKKKNKFSVKEIYKPEFYEEDLPFPAHKFSHLHVTRILHYNITHHYPKYGIFILFTQLSHWDVYDTDHGSSLKK